MIIIMIIMMTNMMHKTRHNKQDCIWQLWLKYQIVLFYIAHCYAYINDLLLHFSLYSLLISWFSGFGHYIPSIPPELWSIVCIIMIFLRLQTKHPKSLKTQNQLNYCGEFPLHIESQHYKLQKGKFEIDNKINERITTNHDLQIS